MDNYDVRIRENDPLGFRELRPAPTLSVDPATGRITGEQTPAAPVRFKQGTLVRPIAPFLELWCDTGDGVLRPLTTNILTAEGLTPASVRWQVRAANLKAFRRTTDSNDRITAEVPVFTDHQKHDLIGRCTNFIANKTIPFGNVQYIQPTTQFPQIRLRFTPGRGFVYGSSKTPADLTNRIVQDIVYRADRPWSMFSENSILTTRPGDIFAGRVVQVQGQRVWESRGYLDDTCEGIVDVQITAGGTTLTTFARFSSGPPDYAPDSFPVRTVVDELEQALLGPTIDVADASPRVAEEIVRRAFETIRLQQTVGINGNEVGGRRISSMAAHDEGDPPDNPFRAYEPIMAPALVDNLALRTLHQSVYGALSGDTAAWFGQVLRDWDKVGDLTNAGRRKMPAMMRGSDGMHLALTRRQVDTVRKSSMQAPTHLTQPQPQGGNPPAPQPLNQTARASGMLLSVKAMEGIEPRPQTIAKNALVEQLTYRAQGNPPGTLLTTAISNCFPGLEFDFRNIWKRFFVEIELHEADNIVVAASDNLANLRGRRLVRIEHAGQTANVTTAVLGPRTVGGPAERLAQGELLEWSNSLATILATAAGQQVNCTFTNAQGGGQTVTRALTVRGIFAPGTAAIPEAVAKPGELSQSLCSPWQNDYLECGCYYWAASRPDYVNVEPAPDGASMGHNWTQVRDANTPKAYFRDPPDPNARSHSYDDLFQRWQELLRFQIEGKDSE